MLEALNKLWPSSDNFSVNSTFPLVATARNTTMLDILVQSLGDKRKNSRTAAVTVIGDMGIYAIPVIANLTDMLEDSHPQVRAAAAKALGKIGYDAAAATPALVKSLNDPDNKVRLWAAWAGCCSSFTARSQK